MWHILEEKLHIFVVKIKTVPILIKLLQYVIENQKVYQLTISSEVTNFH